MGYIEDIEAMELSDEVKQQLITAHRAEVDPLRQSNQSLVAQSRRERVENEVQQLADIGFAETPGLLKFVRRVYLSADADEPGAVLLSDNEMGLAGEQATDSTGREEVSVAGTLRRFIELMPRSDDGKLKIALSSQVTEEEDHGRPAAGSDDPEERAKERRAAVERLAGRPIDRATSRSKRYGASSLVGGE